MKSVLELPWPLSGLNFTNKAILLLDREFLKTRHKNVEYFNLVLAQKPKCFFFLLLPSPFPFVSPGPFTLATLCLSYSFWLPKKFSVNYGQSLEMGPWSIIILMGHFSTIFATSDNVVFKFATSECPWYPKTTLAQIDLLLYHLRIKKIGWH